MHHSLLYFEEPSLEFGFGQKAENPKSGLYFFGPLEEKGRPKHIKIGVVGTLEGIELYCGWSKAINAFIDPMVFGSPNPVPFPGLNAVFSTSIGEEPEIQVQISQSKLARAIRIGRRHEAIKETVSIFEDAIRKSLDEDSAVDVWFVVI